MSAAFDHTLLEPLTEEQARALFPLSSFIAKPYACYFGIDGAGLLWRFGVAHIPATSFCDAYPQFWNGDAWCDPAGRGWFKVAVADLVGWGS